jgi:hypothetical protein
VRFGTGSVAPVAVLNACDTAFCLPFAGETEKTDVGTYSSKVNCPTVRGKSSAQGELAINLAT